MKAVKYLFTLLNTHCVGLRAALTTSLNILKTFQTLPWTSKNSEFSKVLSCAVTVGYSKEILRWHVDTNLARKLQVELVQELVHRQLRKALPVLAIPSQHYCACMHDRFWSPWIHSLWNCWGIGMKERGKTYVH